MTQTSKDNISGVYRSIKEASEKTKISRKHIHARLNNKYKEKSKTGYEWKYK